jgi:D-xylose transport system substrate-binding protein
VTVPATARLEATRVPRRQRMRRTSASIATLGAAAVLGLTGCDADSGGPSGAGSSDGSGGITSACRLDDPPRSAATVPAAAHATARVSGRVSGRVGVILPDTTSSPRYTLYDAPLLTKALQAAGMTADVQNAQGSEVRFAAIAQSMINEGDRVLIVDSIDAASGATVEKAAGAAGVQVIDYDRVNLGGTAAYYVSFDNEDVGKLLAQTMLDCLRAQGVTRPRIIMMDGGTDVDDNAVLIAKGAHEVLDPLTASGSITVEQEAAVTGWKVENAAPAFSQALTASRNQVDGVLAANDTIAGAVIGVLEHQGLEGHVVVTGQDAGTEGLQSVVTGQQSMTVFKNIRLEATATARVAAALMAGKTPAAAGVTLSRFVDPVLPGRNLRALLLPAQVITQANVQDVVKAGALTTADICQDITQACAGIGLR